LIAVFTAIVTPFLSPDSSLGGGERYHSDRFGYSVTLPYGWVRVPADVLEKGLARLGLTGKTGFKCEAAFQSRSDPWFEGAYAIAMVFSTEFQLSEDQIDTTIRTITGVQPEQIEARLDAQVGPGTDVRSNRVRFDKKNRRYIWELATQVGGESWMGRTYGFVGRRSIVHHSFYGPVETSSTAEAQLASSFTFDVGSAYQGHSPSNRTKWEHYVAMALGLVIVNYLRTAVPSFIRKRFPRAFVVLTRNRSIGRSPNIEAEPSTDKRKKA